MNPRVAAAVAAAVVLVVVAGAVGYFVARKTEPSAGPLADAGVVLVAPAPERPKKAGGPGPMPPENASDERKLAWLLAACPKAPCTDDVKLFATKFRRTRSNGDQAMLHTSLESCLKACGGPR